MVVISKTKLVISHFVFFQDRETSLLCDMCQSGMNKNVQDMLSDDGD